jgi:hypothetical protein
MHYESPGTARHMVALVNGTEEIRIPALRRWVVVLFLCFWLVMWTFGGLAGVFQLATEFSVETAIFLCFWAIAWLLVVLMLAWQLAGSEILCVRAGDLETGWRIFGIEKRRLFRGSDIRDLGVGPPLVGFASARFDYPPIFTRQWGSIKFSYGARTIYLAPGVDEAEGRMIAEMLKKRLPQIAAG